MKEMYLKILAAEQGGDNVKIYYSGGEFIASKKQLGKDLIDIEGAKKNGAEAFRDTLNCLVYFLNHGGGETVEKVFGLTDVECILCAFTPKEITDRLEKVKADVPHIPEQGDVYTSKKSGDNIVIMYFDRDTNYVTYISSGDVETVARESFKKYFAFAGRNIDISELIKTVSEKGSGE